MNLGETKKIALVADWITHWGGAERVFAKLMEMYPDADIYTSVFFPTRPEVFAGRRVFTSFIQHIPFFNRKHKMCMLLRPLAFSRFDFSEYDLVISSSSAEAKGIRTRRVQMYNEKGKMKNVRFLKNNPSLNITHGKIEHSPVHLCYCHTPTRYLWSHSAEYKNFLEFGWLNWFARLIIPPAFAIMRKWDYQAAQRPDVLIANSMTTQQRIREYYDRESEVVYPFFSPVPSSSGTGDHCDSRGECDPGIQSNNLGEASLYDKKGRLDNEMDSRVQPENDGNGYFVCLGRIVPYKRFDLAIDACNQLGLKLKIFTNTRNDESERLQKISGPTIEWIYDASDEEVAHGLSHARAFIMPQFEDFGIVALEAMSHGVPVVAYGKGGATETVIDGKTGLHFREQNVQSLTDALTKFPEISWDRDLIREQSEKFSEQVFEKNFRTIVAKYYGK